MIPKLKMNHHHIRKRIRNRKNCSAVNFLKDIFRFANPNLFKRLGSSKLDISYPLLLKFNRKTIELKEVKKMADDKNIIIIILGYILAIFQSCPLGLIYGIVLYFVKNDDPYYKKHALYMIIISIILTIIAIVFFGGLILALFGLAANA